MRSAGSSRKPLITASFGPRDGLPPPRVQHVIASTYPLRLLAKCADPPADVTVIWSDEPLHVEPRPGLLAWHPTDDGYIVDAPDSRILVAVDRAGTSLVVHPNSREVDLADYGLPSIPVTLRGAPRLAADTLVTNVLTALPSLWGQVSVHWAALGTPAGVVLLCARTGWASRRPRRGSAGRDGNCSTTTTPRWNSWAISYESCRWAHGRGFARMPPPDSGYAGGKQALDAGDPTVRRTLAATVHLVQLPNDADAPALEVAPVAATAALVSLSRSMQVVDRTDAAARDRRVRTAQRLAQAPAFSVTYRRDAVAPRAVADAIVDAVGSLEQNLEDSARLPPPCGVLQVDA